MLGNAGVLLQNLFLPFTHSGTPCASFFRGAFLGLLCFESLVFPHGAPLGYVRQTLKQQITDAITIVDCCEIPLVMWQRVYYLSYFFYFT